MTTPQIFAEKCKQSQRKYMQRTKTYRNHRELRELMVRKQVCQWLAYEQTNSSTFPM
jgi:hypothetical protein